MTQFSTLYGRLLTQELGSEDSTRLFTDARRKAAVNDGVQEFNELTECLIRLSTITWASGTLERDLNSTAVIADQDFIRVASRQDLEFHYTFSASTVTILAGPDFVPRTLPWLDRHAPGWRIPSSISTAVVLPAHWYLRPDGGALYLGVTPIPSTNPGSSASMKVLLPYLARPAVLTSDTSEPYTVSGVIRTDVRPFHRAVVNYAAHQLEKLRRDKAASDQQLQVFLSWVTRFMQKVRPTKAKVEA